MIAVWWNNENNYLILYGLCGVFLPYYVFDVEKFVIVLEWTFLM